MAPAVATAAEFESALRAQLHAQFLSHLPPSLLKMRVGDFLQLAAVAIGDQDAVNLEYDSFGTPRTATRRSKRVAASSTLASVAKSVKKRLFAFATPSKIPQTPHLTIKSSVAVGASAGASVMKRQAVSHMKPQLQTVQTASHSQTVSHSQTTSHSQTPSRRARPSVPCTPHATASHAPPPSTPSGGGIVQFQLDDGKVIDVDFSRSPKSALQEANLLGSESIGEVKAKIENYANQFMQYLKFFKKFKPSK